MDCLRRGQFDKAVTLFKHAISLYDEEYEYVIRLGWAQYRHGLKTEDKIDLNYKLNLLQFIKIYDAIEFIIENEMIG